MRVASVRNATKAHESTLSVRTLFSTTSQTTPSSGIPGSGLLCALGRVGQHRAGSVSMIEPSWCTFSARRAETTALAPSRARSATTKVPAGLT